VVAMIWRELVLHDRATSNGRQNYDALSQSRTMVPGVPALGGGAARWPLGLAPRRIGQEIERIWPQTRRALAAANG
jgi:hypothetical protein